MKRIGLVLVLVAACSESAPGVGEQEAELTCRAWCDPINTCGADYGEPPDCLERCMREAEQICGEHHHAKRRCELEMDCNDPFEDCKVHDEGRSQCQTDIMNQCAEQCPEADPGLCYSTRGDCGLVANCTERCPIDPRYCVDNGGQCGVQDWCQQECPPIDGIPARPTWCSLAVGDCERVDACAAACRNTPNPDVFQNCLAGIIEPTDCQ
jgi:hypothetical protein